VTLLHNALVEELSKNLTALCEGPPSRVSSSRAGARGGSLEHPVALFVDADALDFA
jgi:hypothetical protein